MEKETMKPILLLLLLLLLLLDVMARTCNPDTQETEARRLWWGQDQPKLHSKTMSKNNNNTISTKNNTFSKYHMSYLFILYLYATLF